jgi:signal peptidase II
VLRANFSSPHLSRLYMLGAIVWALDLSTKIWAIGNLSQREPLKIIGSFLQLTFLRNSGAAFSLGQGFTALFSFFAIAVLCLIIFFAPRITSKGWSWVLGLSMGGVLGNLTDRIFREPGLLRGHVIDWIQIPWWPVFNIADTAIVVAACIAIVLSFRNIPPIAPLIGKF